MVPFYYDLTTFWILGQRFVKFFVGFLENVRNQKVSLKLSDLYLVCYLNKYLSSIYLINPNNRVMSCQTAQSSTKQRVYNGVNNF